ncbi:hypothetical protein K426_19910 [Sphingobium sp. TKS]|nr:hypothetical protein K426_19910 [Sphingobium sp. TKS]
MKGQSTRSLSEAITMLAFNEEVPASVMPVALKKRRWRCPPNVALAQLVEALHALCDAGYRDDVALWGRTVPGSLEGAPNDSLRRLTKGECLDYRLFVPGYDMLWKGENQGDEYADTFTAHTRSEGLDHVRVDLADLSRLLATHGGTGTAAVALTASAAPFTIAEIDSWIRATPHTSVKKARKEFMTAPRSKGLSATFEARWNAIRQNRVGRPAVR